MSALTEPTSAVLMLSAEMHMAHTPVIAGMDTLAMGQHAEVRALLLRCLHEPDTFIHAAALALVVKKSCYC